MRTSRTKTVGMLVFILLGICIATGCSKTITLSDDPVKDFRLEIQADHPAIEKTTLTFSPLTFHMTHTLKDSIDDEEKAGLFEDSRRFLMSERFDTEVIQSHKISKYFSSGHPNFVIAVRTEDSDSVSRFELYANNEPNAESVYEQWYYAEGEEALGEPYASENSK